MIEEGTAVIGSHVRIKINGVVKTLSGKVTGAALYRLAGDPAVLTGSGGTVQDTSEPVQVKHDEEFTAKYKFAQDAKVSEDHVAAGDEGVKHGTPSAVKSEADKKKILDEIIAGHGGPYGAADGSESAAVGVGLETQEVHESVL
jgi:hypothetical protein